MSDYYEPGETAIINSPPVGVTTLEPFSMSQPSTRAHRKLAYRAEMDAYQEHHKARIGQSIIMNTTALSTITDQVSALVPSAEEPCREVVRAYARSSANRLAERW